LFENTRLIEDCTVRFTESWAEAFWAEARNDGKTTIKSTTVQAPRLRPTANPKCEILLMFSPFLKIR